MDPSGDIIGKVKCVVSMDEKLDETLMKLQLLKPLIGASMYHDWRTSFMDNVENTFDEDAVATLEIKLRIVQNDLRDIPDDILSHPLARHLGGRDSSLGTNLDIQAKGKRTMGRPGQSFITCYIILYNVY